MKSWRSLCLGISTSLGILINDSFELLDDYFEGVGWALGVAPGIFGKLSVRDPMIFVEAQRLAFI